MPYQTKEIVIKCPCCMAKLAIIIESEVLGWNNQEVYDWNLDIKEVKVIHPTPREEAIDAGHTC